MAAVNRPNVVSNLHAMNFLYLTFAHSTDDSLTQLELDTIVVKVKEWNKDNEVFTNAVLEQTIQWYKSCTDWDTTFAECKLCIESLLELPKELRKVVLDDLWEIAEADGDFKDEEKETFKVIADSWGFNVKF